MLSSHFTYELDKMIDCELCDVSMQFGTGTANAKAFGLIRLTLLGDKA